MDLRQIQLYLKYILLDSDNRRTIGIYINNIPSWNMLFNQIMEVFKNPSMLISVIAAITGVVINPNTRGLTDKENK